MPRPPGMLAPLASAVLVILVLAGSFFTFGARRSRWHGDVPAILPVVTTPATPAAGEVVEETLLEIPSQREPFPR